MSNNSDSPAKGNTGNKPVYVDGDVAVFLNTREIKNGPNAGKSYDVFTWSRGRGEDARRIDVPTSIGGYDLRNVSSPGEKYSDVCDLIDGKEIVVGMTGKPKEGQTDGKPYDLILAGTKLIEITDEATQKVKFRRLAVEAAFAEYSKEDPEHKKVRAFTIAGLDDQGQLLKEKNLKSYRHVAPPKDQQPNPQLPIWIKIEVKDAVAARDALAAGVPFSFERKGCEVKVDGFDNIPDHPGLKVIKWNCQVLAKQQGADESAPLPTRRAPATAGASH